MYLKCVQAKSFFEICSHISMIFEIKLKWLFRSRRNRKWSEKESDFAAWILSTNFKVDRENAVNDWVAGFISTFSCSFFSYWYLSHLSRCLIVTLIFPAENFASFLRVQRIWNAFKELSFFLFQKSGHNFVNFVLLMRSQHEVVIIDTLV